MKLLHCAGLQDHASDGVPDRVQVLGTLKNMRMSVIQTNVRTSRIITNNEFMLPKYNYCRQNRPASTLSRTTAETPNDGLEIIFLVTILPHNMHIAANPFSILYSVP